VVLLWCCCDVLWCGVVWCGVVWCGVVWCGVVWCGVLWCAVLSFYSIPSLTHSLHSLTPLSSLQIRQLAADITHNRTS
jgi:hypothetical protein